MPADPDLDLTALRTFRAILREGSLTAAAQGLKAPKSTVSKRLRDLEASLGVALIERSTRALRPTAEGALLAARAERLLAEAEDIRRALRDTGSAPAGHLRIALPTLFGQLVMGGVAARLRARHPEITLECVFLDRPADMREEGFDGMVRLGQPDPGEVSRRIGASAAVLVAAPGLPGLAGLTDPTGLAALPLIGYSPALPGPWVFRRGAHAHCEIVPRPVLALGSALAVRDAAVLGAGATLLPWFLARPLLQAGKLVHLCPDWQGPRKEIHFLYPSPQAATARLRAFVEQLVAEVARHEEDWLPPCETAPGEVQDGSQSLAAPQAAPRPGQWQPPQGGL